MLSVTQTQPMLLHNQSRVSALSISGNHQDHPISSESQLGCLVVAYIAIADILAKMGADQEARWIVWPLLADAMGVLFLRS